MQRVLRALWPMLLWMGVMFTLSTDLGSANHTGGVLEPILRWINPHISAAGISHAHFLVRKAAHVTEYAVLAFLVLRALRILRETPVTRWSWRLATLAFCASAAYGASDEIHQLFVPSRGPSVHDVLIDSSGAALGLALTFLWWRARRETTEAAAT